MLLCGLAFLPHASEYLVLIPSMSPLGSLKDDREYVSYLNIFGTVVMKVGIPLVLIRKCFLKKVVRRYPFALSSVPALAAHCLHCTHPQLLSSFERFLRRGQP